MMNLPKNVWIVAITFSFVMSGISLLLFVGGLIGTELAPLEQLATLPIAMFVAGSACATIPAALLAGRFGRKKSAYIGFGISLLSVIICFLGVEHKDFILFNVGSLLIGCGTAFYHQFRFAAIESLNSATDVGPALSVIMLCSIVGALVGPELGSIGRDMMSNFAPYTGSFLLYGVMVMFAMLSFSFFQNPPEPQTTEEKPARHLFQLVFQPAFLIALASAAIGYALMSFLMTSTPISMHVIDGHSLHSAKGVIQAHLIAMFLPSLFSGQLIKIFGAEKIMFIGAVLYLAVIAVALSGQHVLHYWWALVLLGVGWNFLFLSGTTLLPNAYRHNERFKAQAVNDFTVFALQACASLSAAWVLFRFGWATQLWLCLVPTLVLLFAAFVLIVRKSQHKPAGEDTLPIHE